MAPRCKPVFCIVSGIPSYLLAGLINPILQMLLKCINKYSILGREWQPSMADLLIKI